MVGNLAEILTAPAPAEHPPDPYWVSEWRGGSMIQTYGVRGLTCWRCMVSVIDEVRSLPGVDAVQVDLVPFGESRVSVVPEGAVTRDQVRASLGHAGFDLVAASVDSTAPDTEHSQLPRSA
jgi:copper chaperone CopZ